MNIHEHGVLHSPNEIMHNIWWFGNDIELRRKFGHHFLVALEWNAAPILISTDSTSHEMQLRYWYRLILRRMKCMTCSQFLLTCNSQYFQGRIPFKFFRYLNISRRQGRKMALTSLNVYTTSHPLRQTSLYVSRHWLLERILEVVTSLARWEVNLRWPSTGCRQIHTTEWIVWIWF